MSFKKALSNVMKKGGKSKPAASKNTGAKKGQC